MEPNEQRKERLEIELPFPSQEILELICQGNDLIYSYEICPRGDELFEENVGINFLVKVSALLMEYYKINTSKEEKDRCSQNRVFNVVGEALTNCYHHSSEDKNILVGIFLGEKGVCYAFNDGGEYFKSEEIKRQYEEKISITEFNEATTKGQAGVNDCIFPYSDFIQVDTETGTLYCVQLKEDIIAPEGEQGDSYFYHRDNER